MQLHAQVGLSIVIVQLLANSYCSLSRVSNMKFMVAFWPLVSALIPEAISHPQQCEDTFTLGHTLFKKLAETSISELNLGDLVKQWGSLLLSHECVEVCQANRPQNCSDNCLDRGKCG